MLAEHAGDAVDDADQLRVGLFEFSHGGIQSADGMPERFGIFCLARGFLRGHFGKGGDAFSLFLVRFGKRGNFAPQLAQQLQQLGAMGVVHGPGIPDAALNF